MSPRVMEITVSHVQTRVNEGGCRTFLSFDECLSDYFYFFLIRFLISFLFYFSNYFLFQLLSFLIEV